MQQAHMDYFDVSLLPFMIFMYLVFFGVLILPLLIFGYKSYTSANDQNGRTIGLLALAAVVIGFFAYITVDYFESINLAAIWFLMMLSILGAPLFLAFKTATKPAIPKNIKKPSVSKKKKSSSKK